MNTSLLPDESVDDEIITEVRAIREALAAEFDHDLDKLYEEAKRREQKTDRPRLPATPKRLPLLTSP